MEEPERLGSGSRVGRERLLVLLKRRREGEEGGVGVDF